MSFIHSMLAASGSWQPSQPCLIRHLPGMASTPIIHANITSLGHGHLHGKLTPGRLSQADSWAHVSGKMLQGHSASSYQLLTLGFR